MAPNMNAAVKYMLPVAPILVSLLQASCLGACIQRIDSSLVELGDAGRASSHYHYVSVVKDQVPQPLYRIMVVDEVLKFNS